MVDVLVCTRDLRSPDKLTRWTATGQLEYAARHGHDISEAYPDLVVALDDYDLDVRNGAIKALIYGYINDLRSKDDSLRNKTEEHIHFLARNTLNGSYARQILIEMPDDNNPNVRRVIAEALKR